MPFSVSGYYCPFKPNELKHSRVMITVSTIAYIDILKTILNDIVQNNEFSNNLKTEDIGGYISLLLSIQDFCLLYNKLFKTNYDNTTIDKKFIQDIFTPHFDLILRKNDKKLKNNGNDLKTLKHNLLILTFKNNINLHDIFICNYPYHTLFYFLYYTTDNKVKEQLYTNLQNTLGFINKPLQYDLDGCHYSVIQYDMTKQELKELKTVIKILGI